MTRSAAQAESAKSLTVVESRGPLPMNDDMRRFRRRVVCFVFIPCLLFAPWLPIGFVFGRQLLERAKGPTAETQIDKSFENAGARDYELLLLGNSRIRCPRAPKGVKSVPAPPGFPPTQEPEMGKV